MRQSLAVAVLARSGLNSAGSLLATTYAANSQGHLLSPWRGREDYFEARCLNCGRKIHVAFDGVPGGPALVEECQRSGRSGRH